LRINKVTETGLSPEAGHLVAILFSRRKITVWCVAALASLAACGAFVPAHAENLDAPLVLVVGYAPGGSTDRMARLIAERLSPKLGVPVTVENRPGEGGRLAAKQIKRAPAGENVLMLGNPAVMVVAPLVFKDAGYDPDKDFVPVSQVSSYDFALAVGNKLQLDRAMFLVGRLWAHPEEASSACRLPAACRTSSASWWAMR
jgi:tripartite-type tricarboxylate transporter receptor subunit TctC